MYGIYANIYHQYTPNVSIYTIHGSYGLENITNTHVSREMLNNVLDSRSMKTPKKEQVVGYVLFWP